MICLAARFSQDDRPIYQTLYPHAKSLLHKAINEGHCHVTTVQAISCFVFWGLPRESKQTWQRLGHAIRLAYQLGMHVPRTSDLPLDDAEAKVILVSRAVRSQLFWAVRWLIRWFLRIALRTGKGRGTVSTGEHRLPGSPAEYNRMRLFRFT
jgi:hypothetical protein